MKKYGEHCIFVGVEVGGEGLFFNPVGGCLS